MARICIIRRFFCCDLQVGTYCVALFCMALDAVNIWAFVQAINAIRHEQKENAEVTLVRVNLTEAVIKVSYTGIGFLAADMSMAMFLVCGACQLKTCMLWSWIAWRFMMFAHLVGVTAFFFIAWEKVPPVGIILLVDIIVTFACFIVVFSLIQEIKEVQELQDEISLRSPAVLLGNQERLSSPERYF